jgi:hypothetical protein
MREITIYGKRMDLKHDLEIKTAKCLTRGNRRDYGVNYWNGPGTERKNDM